MLLASGGATALDYTALGEIPTNVDGRTGDLGLVAGNFDGDRRPDMAMCLRGESIHIFSQDPAGQQVLRQTEKLWEVTIPYPGASPYVIFRCRLHVQDLDANGLDDLVVTHSLGTVVLRFFPDGRVARQEYAESARLAMDGFRDSVMADFDGDGDQDLMGLREDGRTVSLRLNPGDGRLGPSVGIGRRMGQEAWDFQLAAGDLDGNGLQDLAMSIWGSQGGALELYFNDGRGRLLAGDRVPPSRGGFVAIGDVTGDAKDDLVLSTGGVSVHEQDGDGTLKPPVEYGSYTMPEGLAIRDRDGDGRNDVLVLHPRWLAVSSFLQLGDGTLEYDDLLFPVSNMQLGKGAVAIRDFRGDGCADLLVASEHYLWFEGTGCLPASNADVSATVQVHDGSTRLQVENRDASSPAFAVVATLRLDSTGITTFFPAAPSGCTVSDSNRKARVYVCRIGRLEPGEIRTYTLAYTHKSLPKGRYSVDAVARVSSHGDDPVQANNFDRRNFWRVNRMPATQPEKAPASLPGAGLAAPAPRRAAPARATPAPVQRAIRATD